MAKTPKYTPDLSFEQDIAAQHGNPVAGIDEAGRGPLAGPVVAGAVILDLAHIPDGLNDSKALTPARRDSLYDQITGSAAWGVGIVSPAEIDTINILQATMKAMQLAAAHLPVPAAAFLIDGNRCPKLSAPATAIVKGDARSLSIAAASIVAKVTRDRIMCELDKLHPGYDWASNMGYGTQTHRDALMALGPTPHHRHSFAPVKTAHDMHMQLK